jgi:signal transduction histidine kinase
MTPELVATQIRQRRTSAMVAAAFVTAFHAVDAGAGYGGGLVATRIAWAAALVWFGFGRPMSAAGELRRAGAVALASGLALTAIVAQSGGIESIYFGYLYALPFAVLVLLPDAGIAALVSSGATLAGGAAILVAADAPVRSVLAYCAASAGTCLLAVVASHGYRAMRRAELEAERARNAAQASLAESERRRAHAERLALVGQLAAGVAHEVNNPLSFVKSNVRWTREALGEGAPGEDARAELVEALEEAELGLAQIVGIVSDLRSFARGDPEGVERCCASDAIDQALRITSSRVGAVARVACERPAEPIELRMPSTRAVQALVNLLVNAADAIASTGRTDGTIRVSLRADGDAAEVRVEDDGPGLSPDAAAHLFEPFFTTKGAQGTGLGLALTREYVLRYGGTVEVGARPGGGAAFTLRVPRPAGRALEQEPQQLSRTGTT